MKQLKERHVVVLVDDEPEVLSALRRALRKEPHPVLATSRPAEALRWVEAIDVSAVVSDHRMPGMTGTELAEDFARLLGHAVPTVMLTGDPANAEVPWLADAPVWVARKPLHAATLLAALPPLVAFRRAVAASAAPR